jgi:hypothetical protein
MLGGLVTVLAGHLIQKAKLRAYAFALYAGAAASLLVAAVFALVALRHWIAVTYDTQYPDLWIALIFVIVAAVFGGVGYYFHIRKPKTNPAADIAILAAPSALKLAGRGAARGGDWHRADRGARDGPKFFQPTFRRRLASVRNRSAFSLMKPPASL